MEKIFDDGLLQSTRFTCDCLWAGHSMTVTIERNSQGKVVMCSFEPYLAGKPRLWWRIKQAIKCLRGMDGELGDFGLREEDYPDMVNLISSLVLNSSTSSN